MDLLELAAALKHDVAKAIAWRSANYYDLGESTNPPSANLIAAWQADLGLVPTAGDSPSSNLSAWLADVRSWPQPWPVEIQAAEAALTELEALAEPIAQGDPTQLSSVAESIKGAQMTIRSQLAKLVRRLRSESRAS